MMAGKHSGQGAGMTADVMRIAQNLAHHSGYAVFLLVARRTSAPLRNTASRTPRANRTPSRDYGVAAPET